MMRLDAPALIADAAPVPKPGRGEILVRIFAAGVAPTELLWYPTTHTCDGSKRSGAVPGLEFSGNHRSSRQRGRVRPDRSQSLHLVFPCRAGNPPRTGGADAIFCTGSFDKPVIHFREDERNRPPDGSDEKTVWAG